MHNNQLFSIEVKISDPLNTSLQKRS